MISGLILSSYEWPWVFYFFGLISVVWFIIFVSFATYCAFKKNKIWRSKNWRKKSQSARQQTILCYSDPGSHPFISKEEREYLQAEIGQLKRNDDLPPTPWFAILTSVPMIALVFAQVRTATRVRARNAATNNNKILFAHEREYMTSWTETMANIQIIFRFPDWTRLGLLHYGNFTCLFSLAAITIWHWRRKIVFHAMLMAFSAHPRA